MPTYTFKVDLVVTEIEPFTKFVVDKGYANGLVSASLALFYPDDLVFNVSYYTSNEYSESDIERILLEYADEKEAR